MDLFDSQERSAQGSCKWPASERFPLNIGTQRVEEQVWQDLLDSPAPLIVAGYSSLDRIIDFIASAEKAESVRLLCGQDPFDARRSEFHRLSRDRSAAGVEA